MASIAARVTIGLMLVLMMQAPAQRACADGNTGIIRLQVVNEATQQPISGAKVHLLTGGSYGRELITDGAGRAIVFGVPPERVHILAFAANYRPLCPWLRVTVITDQIIEIHIRLKYDARPMLWDCFSGRDIRPTDPQPGITSDVYNIQ